MAHILVRTPDSKFRMWDTVVDMWISDKLGEADMRTWLVENDGHTKAEATMRIHRKGYKKDHVAWLVEFFDSRYRTLCRSHNTHKKEWAAAAKIPVKKKAMELEKYIKTVAEESGKAISRLEVTGFGEKNQQVANAIQNEVVFGQSTITKRGITGQLVAVFKKGIVLYQPENGIGGSWVLVPNRGGVLVGSRSEVLKEARKRDRK